MTSLEKLYIRKATSEDAQELGQLYYHFMKEAIAAGAQSFTLQPLEEYVQEASAELAKKEMVNILVIDENKVIAFIDWYIVPYRKYLFIDTVYVMKSYEGQGIAKYLLSLAEQEAIDNNCDIKLEVYDWNHRARDIYEHLGYKTDGLVMVKSPQNATIH